MDVEPDDKSVFYFVGIDGARFKRPVVPGDQLMLEVELERAKSRHLQVQGARARVDGETRCRGRADVHDAHAIALTPRAAGVPRP